MIFEKYRKILVRMPGEIKDIIDALALLSSLKEAFPFALIYVLIEENMEAMLRNFDSFIIILFKKTPRFTPTLKDGEDVITFIQKGEFDLGIVCTDSFSSAYMFYQGMVKKIIGFKRAFGSFMLTDLVERGSIANLMAPTFAPFNKNIPKIYAKKNKQCFLTIGLSCTLAREEIKKKWYSELIDFIIEAIPDVKIFILGKVSEAFDIRRLIKEGAGAVFDRTAEKSLADTIDLIYNLDVYISDDENLLALGKALSTPVVNINGLIDNKTLLPEDYFHLIKDALLKPLKDSTSDLSFAEYTPIKEDQIKKANFLYKEKNVGVIILAGGMGRRLGFDKPKGLLNLGNDCLYDILIKKSKGAKKIGILTSPLTFSETKSYLANKEIDLFHAKAYPTESGYAVSPEGNGSLFDGVVHSEYWKDWRHLDLISVIAVDNPLADPLDKQLLASDAELTVIGVERDIKETKLGVLCKHEKSLVVREYFTLGKDGLEGLGYSGSFAATPVFFEKVAFQNLPFYQIEKNNEVFFERLLIDGFIFAKNFEVISKKRKDCFFPIKEKADIISFCKKMDTKELVI